MFTTNFIDNKTATKLAVKYDTPLYVYSKEKLIESAQTMLSIPVPFGLTVRFAMKANPNPDVLKIFHSQGVMIDASSGYEAENAIRAGYKPEDILLTSQQIPRNLRLLVERGVQYNATSLHQLKWYGELFGGTEFNNVSVRINPGVGSGFSNKTNVGGPTSSFGIWHEYIPKANEIADDYDLKIVRLHTHIGAGTDPEVWQEVAKISLSLVNHFKDVVILNLGGGFKIARIDSEKQANMQEIGKMLADEISNFSNESGRKLHLELEPGTFLAANAGVLLARVEDIVDTGPDGYTFIKLNTGMNDILRPTLYGAQHPIALITEEKNTGEYVVVGHNCESGDLLTTDPGDPESIRTITLPIPKIQDIVVIGGVGAYCASMAAHGYNSYPSAKEIVI
jgi:diaminopimelate decarboxylase